MGLFDFVRNIGKKVFPSSATPEDAAEKIKKEVDAANLGIDNLVVTYKDGNCMLTGGCQSEEAVQKAILIAGNIEGVENVSFTNLTPPPAVPAEQEKKVEYYLIQKGDTLSKIAKQFYGDANAYPRIFEANREVIKDANLIYPGQKIRIPME